MAKITMSACDKMVRRALYNHSCQTSQQLKTYSNRMYNEDYSVGTIGAALRKLTTKGLAGYSQNEKGQKVYWLTDFGEDMISQSIVKGEL